MKIDIEKLMKNYRYCLQENFDRDSLTVANFLEEGIQSLFDYIKELQKDINYLIEDPDNVSETCGTFKEERQVMTFEEALTLMRQGKMVTDKNGIVYRLEGKEFEYRIKKESVWNWSPHFSNDIILGEWNIYIEPGYQYLFRKKGTQAWGVLSNRYMSLEEVEKIFEDAGDKDFEFRRIEP